MNKNLTHFNKSLISRLINSPKNLLLPLLVMGPISLSIPALAFEDYVDNDVIYTASLQFNPSETESVKQENSYNNSPGYNTVDWDYNPEENNRDNGYFLLEENMKELKRKLVEKYSFYHEDEKSVILSELLNSGGVHFHGILKDNNGEKNDYEYSLNIDPQSDKNTPYTLDTYLQASADAFNNIFRHYVEVKQNEGRAAIYSLTLTATTPTINNSQPIYPEMANALGLFDSNKRPLNPASVAGKKKQNEIFDQMVNEAHDSGDITKSSTFVNIATKLTEQWTDFSDMSEDEKQKAAEGDLSAWIKKQKIAKMTDAQNKLKDDPITPNILFLRQLGRAMGVSDISIAKLTTEKHWKGKSVFQHFSTEASMFNLLNALVPDRETASPHGGGIASSPTFSVNSNREGHSKQEIVYRLYKGLEVVDENKKAEFLKSLDIAFGVDPDHYDAGSHVPFKDDTVFLEYDSLPPFLKNNPAYFEKTREKLANENRKAFHLLEARKHAIENGSEADLDAAYSVIKQAQPDDAFYAPELAELGLSQEQNSKIEAEANKFYLQLIAASDKNAFKALSSDRERNLKNIAELAALVPGVGNLVALGIYIDLGEWTDAGLISAAILVDVASFGTARGATAIGGMIAKGVLLKTGSHRLAIAAGKVAANSAAKAFKLTKYVYPTVKVGLKGTDLVRAITGIQNANDPVEAQAAKTTLYLTIAMLPFF
jgi:hypothetical protein